MDLLRIVQYYIGDYYFLEYILHLMGNYKSLMRSINAFVIFPMFFMEYLMDFMGNVFL